MITFSDFKINLKKRWKVSVFLINLSLVVGLGLTIIQPFLYKTNFSILLVQDTKNSTNVYSTIESSDGLARLLERVIKTSEFRDSVLKSNDKFNINPEDFSDNEAKRRKEWNSMVKTGVVPGTGIINVDVYFKNKLGAEEYANAIIDKITNDGANIYGGSEAISFRVINSPLTSEKPASPNIVLNVILSLMTGCLMSIFYAYFTTVEIKKVDVFYDEELQRELEKKNSKVVADKNSSDRNFIENIRNSSLGSENKDDVKSDTELKREDLKVFDREEQQTTPEVEFLKNMNDRMKNVFDER